MQHIGNSGYYIYKKAAEELTTRFQTKLENEWRVEDLSKNKNLESALANFDQCF